jgi:hypothetical protein
MPGLDEPRTPAAPWSRSRRAERERAWSTTGGGGSGTGSTSSVTTFRAGRRLRGLCVLSAAASSWGARIARRVPTSVGVGERCGSILVGSRGGGRWRRSRRDALLPGSWDRPGGPPVRPLGEWLVSCVAEAAGPDPRPGQPHVLVRGYGYRGSPPQAGPGAGRPRLGAPLGLLHPQPERRLIGQASASRQGATAPI